MGTEGLPHPKIMKFVEVSYYVSKVVLQEVLQGFLGLFMRAPKGATQVLGFCRDHLT